MSSVKSIAPPFHGETYCRDAILPDLLNRSGFAAMEEVPRMRMLTFKLGLLLGSSCFLSVITGADVEASEDHLGWARKAIARADTTADPETRKQLLQGACRTFLQASVPDPDSPCEDEGRQSPGPAWTEYLALARQLLDSETCKKSGVRESFLLLTPRFVSRLSDLHFWPRVLYGSQFRAPIEMAQELACSPEEKFIAVAALADYELVHDWAEAVGHYREACALYDKLDTATEVCAPARLARDLLESEIRNELLEIRTQVKDALNLRIERTGVTPAMSEILDPSALWELVLPYFEGYSPEHHHPCHMPLGGPFEGSPLSTTPGIRPTGFRSIPWEGRVEHLIQFTEVRS